MENEYPWQVGLLLSIDSTPFCVGALISKKEFLTSRTCTRLADYTAHYVLLGEHDLTMIGGEKRFRVRQGVCQDGN